MLLFLIILWPPCHPYIRLCSAIASEWTVCGSQSADRRLRCPPPAAHCSRARRPAPIYLVELASSFLVVSGPPTSHRIGHSFPLGHLTPGHLPSLQITIADIAFRLVPGVGSDQTWNWVIGSPGQWVIRVIFHIRVTGSSF